MRLATALLATTILTPIASRAQDTTFIELGIDAQVVRNNAGSGSTAASLPVGRFRIGWQVNPAWSVEPFISATAVSAGSTRVSNYTIGLGALYHFATDRAKAQPYVRPYLSTTQSHTKTSTLDAKNASLTLGAGLGIKIPMDRNIQWRLEGAYENQVGDSHFLAIAGISFFTW